MLNNKYLKTYLPFAVALSLCLALFTETSAPAQSPPAAPAEARQNNASAPTIPAEPVFVYRELKPAEDMKKQLREVHRVLQRHHYIKRKLDDDFSAEILEEFLFRVDGERAVFLRDEIEGFRKKYAKNLDEAIPAGNADMAYEVFNLYRQRMLDRLNELLAPDGAVTAKISSLSFTIDENLLVDRRKAPWPNSPAEALSIQRKIFKNQVLFMLLEGKKTQEITDTMRKRLRDRRRRLQRLLPRDVFSVFVNSYTELYDSHTNFMNKTNKENFDINIRLSLEGIGAVLRQAEEYIEVVSITPGGPAEKQGELQPKDKIIAVAQGDEKFTETVGWRLDEVINLIRGRRGTQVRLKVVTAGSEQTEEQKIISIVRDKINLETQAAKKELINLEHESETKRIGVITLPSFYHDFRAQQRGEPNYRSSTRDVIRLLGELEKEDIDGLVIDLRNNGGGSLQEAIRMVGLFIESGPVVQVQRSNGRIVRDGKIIRTPYYDKPLAVFINRLSASASEIFSGAIQDYGRGVVIGAKSFGKGTVQSLQPISGNSQVKLTDAKFYRISGASTQLEGVSPDVHFPPAYDMREHGEEHLEHPMPWDRISGSRHRHYYDISKIRSELQQKHNLRVAEQKEFKYLQARQKLWDWRRRHNETVSLNEEERRMQREKFKTLQEEVKNIKNPSAKKSTDTATITKTKEKEKNKSDPLLIEAALVLLDSVDLLSTIH